MAQNKEQLWQNYWENGDDDSITKLINYYIDIIKNTAAEVIVEHPDRALIDNLYADGLFAMKDCILAYPKGCPTAFEEYCSGKIKEAMVEEMDSWQSLEGM